MQPRNAALLLLLTAVTGQGVLRWRSSRGDGATIGLIGGRAGAPPAAQRTRAAEHAGEVGPGEKIDLDRAVAGELVRLPGVGPGLAKRIVTERKRGGAFGGPACLDARVAGIGAGFLRKAGDHLAFSTGACEPASGQGGRTASGQEGNTASGQEGRTASGRTVGCPLVVDLNAAGKRELECLPGIGAARAESILTARGRRGGFRGVEELGEVSGVPPSVVEGLRGRVTVGPLP